jgi:phosphoglycerate dehydrogenase-like enzyme
LKLLLKDSQSQSRLNYIAERLHNTWTLLPHHHDTDPAAFQASLAQADALVAMSFSSQAGQAGHAENLKLLQIPGAGFDRVDFDAVPAQCSVCNVFEHEIPIAEYLVLCMLESLIRMQRMSQDLREGRWTDGVTCPEPIHGELFGKTVGFIGYGHIAKETAKRLEAFGVKAIACTRSPHKGGPFLDRVEGMDGLNRLLRESDFVIVTCPLTATTRGLIGAEQLARMKPGAVLANVARAQVVDEAALFAACKTSRIGGAILDVWTNYPDGSGSPTFPSEHAFQTLDNVTMTPHASGWTDGLWDRRWSAMCENLNRLANGEELHNVLRSPGGSSPS